MPHPQAISTKKLAMLRGNGSGVTVRDSSCSAMIGGGEERKKGGRLRANGGAGGTFYGMYSYRVLNAQDYLRLTMGYIS